MFIVPLYEDNHLLIVNKPAGIVTQPDGKQPTSLETEARAWIKEKYHKEGNVFLHALHRLDRPASGVVLFAKTSKALSRLNLSLKEKKCQKSYLALIEGDLPQTEGLLIHDLVHGEFQAIVVTQETKGAKKASLFYRLLKKEKAFSLIAIELETGRYHQIRAQLAAIGCPIVGDAKYGSKMVFFPDSIALHHHRLAFPHPISHQWLTIVAPLPSQWPIKKENEPSTESTEWTS